MSSQRKIVHISPSALAGAPGMLARAQTELGGHRAVHFRARDYGPARDVLSVNSLEIRRNALDRELFFLHTEDADVIHVHNFVPPLLLEWLAEIDGINDRTLVYQLHSPVGERPVYKDLSSEHGLQWDAKLTVSQCHPRMYPDLIAVPNCLYRHGIAPDSRVAKRGSGPLRIVFSPSTKSRRRWASKSSPDFERMLQVISRDPRFQLRKAIGLSPERVAAIRLVSDVSIDEVITGGFHLVSYEGLAAGNVVINNADDLSMAALSMGTRTSEQPPFVRVEVNGLLDQLYQLARNRPRVHDLMDAGHDYFWRHLNPGRVVDLYDEIYQGHHADAA